MDIQVSAIIGGRYRIERPLSRGGMGTIWVARHVHLGFPVALKLMDPALAGSPEFRARFEREARAAASLRSPHVVNVQDYGIDRGVLYLVMELLEGEDLQQQLERRGRLPLLDVARIVTQVGRALCRAHDAGLVHRDLKPQNIFLARVDGEEVVKILDFGIAKEMRPGSAGDLTRPGEVMGSPHYMSPEQVRADKALDLRSDLWSLGVIVYRCATGRLPFLGEALGEVMAKILIDPIPRMAEVAPDLPAALDAFFAAALARDRAQRFRSAREMADALVQIAGAPPSLRAVPAETMTAAGISTKPVDRARRAQAAAASIGLLLLVLAGVVTTVRFTGSEPAPAVPMLASAPEEAAEPAPPVEAAPATRPTGQPMMAEPDPPAAPPTPHSGPPATVASRRLAPQPKATTTAARPSAWGF